MKKTVKAWAYVENGKIQFCDVASYESRALCIHDKRMGVFGQKVTTLVTITYEIPKRKGVRK